MNVTRRIKKIMAIDDGEMTGCCCGSNHSYSDCCEPCHLGTMLPGTAEQLMRSRYSAYCHKLADYLFETHYPSKRPARLLESLATTFQNTKWTELEVLTTRKGKSKDKNGWVEFKAHYLQDGVPGILRENSRFVNEKGRWYYLSGQQL